MNQASSEPEQKRWWRRNVTALGLLGVLITLVFNTVSACQTTQEAKFQSREAAKNAEEFRLARLDSQVAMLTRISSLLSQTDVAVNQTRVHDLACGRPVQVSRRDKMLVLTEMHNYDYLAWLFQQPSWTLRPAETYWRRSMLRALDLAKAVYVGPSVDAEFPHLAAFRDRTARRPPPPDCH